MPYVHLSQLESCSINTSQGVAAIGYALLVWLTSRASRVAGAEPLGTVPKTYPSGKAGRVLTGKVSARSDASRNGSDNLPPLVAPTQPTPDAGMPLAKVGTALFSAAFLTTGRCRL